MKTRIFVLGASPTARDASFDAVLRRTFGETLPSEDALSYYRTVREATGAIGKAFTDADAILFFADLSKYGDLKEILCKAFGVELVVDDQMLLAAETIAPDLEETDLKFSSAHAGVPEGAAVFVLGDGLYAGFALKRGRQTVIVLPWEKERTGVLLVNQVLPYMNDRFHLSLSGNAIRYADAQALSDAVIRQDVKIAIAGTKTEKLLRRFIADTPELDDRFLTVQKLPGRGNTSPGEFMVNLSITAAEFLGLPYGVAMSAAYYTDDDPNAPKTVYFAVTNDEETTLNKLTSFYGESVSDFMFRCCRELCSLLARTVNADAGVMEEEPKPETREEKKKIRLLKVFIAVVLALILAVGGFGWYYFSQHNYTLKNWADTYLAGILPEKRESDIFGVETTAAPPAATEDVF